MCLFLPLFRVCNDSWPPILLPPIWWPYMLGLAVALAASSYPSGLRVFAIVLRVLIVAFAIGWSVVFHESSMPGNVITVFGAIAAMVSLWPGPHERVCARSGLAAGAAACCWFAGMLAYEDILFGAYVSLVSAVAMTLGCAWWLWEARDRQVPFVDDSTHD